ncbi:MAG: SMP-30/gluconolactonase/LRE family protein, partial [Rhizobiaceae bacterium]
MAAMRIDGGPFELGEGPHFDRAIGTAWWLDIAGQALVEHRFAAQQSRIHPLPRMASLVARIDDDSQLLAMDDGLYRRALASGRLERLVALEEDRPENRSNDGRVHPSGRLWIGTMGRRAEPEAGAIYWSDGIAIRRLFPGITIPNGICFSDDGRTAFFADSARDIVWRVATDPASGLPAGEPEPFLTAANLPTGGHFDGSVIDADGVMWNAAWGAGAVNGFAPDGTVVKSFAVPARQVTCPCFVGPGLDRMLVTSAFEGMDAAARLADPGAGHVFV